MILKTLLKPLNKFNLYRMMQGHWDGDVTALAGAMSLGENNVLGIAMGTSEAGGFVDAQGRITGWLKENIHKHASMYKPGELFEKCCGKFDAKYYIDYLTEKFSKLYNL